MGIQREADAVVVGAGLAGLMAARVLAREGIEAVVLEARDRVGGRIVNEPVGDGAVAELGGQWIAHRDYRMRALVKELGIGTFPSYDRGKHLMDLDKTRSYRGNVPRARVSTLLDLGQARLRLDLKARKVPAAAPWEAPDAAQLDAMTTAAWFDRTVRTSYARQLLDTAITSVWGEDPHGVNLLSTLSYINSAGNFDGLTAAKGGLLQDRVVGGSARVAETIAAELGDRIVYGSPVTAITDNGSGVEVESEDVRVTARRVIVTVPPALALGIRFEPGLPGAHRRALESLPLGTVIKLAAVYERPFWRDRKMSGRAVTINGPVTGTFDGSPKDGGPGVLVAFVPGTRARRFRKLPEAERREAALNTFKRLFGEEAGRPERFIERDWTAETWSGGCYFGLPANGTMTELLPTFGQPTGLIHWAGAETYFKTYGSMDAALVSGERAAHEVLEAAPAGTSSAPRAAIAAP